MTNLTPKWPFNPAKDNQFTVNCLATDTTYAAFGDTITENQLALLRINHGIVGMLTEMPEVQEAVARLSQLADMLELFRDYTESQKQMVFDAVINAVEEIGDGQWYRATYWAGMQARFSGGLLKNLNKARTKDFGNAHIFEQIPRILDLWKKIMHYTTFDEQAMHTYEHGEKLARLVVSLEYLLITRPAEVVAAEIGRLHAILPTVVPAELANPRTLILRSRFVVSYKLLKKRYGAKFSELAANERDTVSELRGMGDVLCLPFPP